MVEWHGAKYWQNRSSEERLRNMRIPSRYLDKPLSSFDLSSGDTEAFNALMVWRKDFDEHYKKGMGLVLHGPTGVGKTHLAQAIVRDIITSELHSAMFITADRYADMLYDEQRNKGELPEPYSDPYLLKYMRRVFDILVLDGLGAERATTDFIRNGIVSLIENRYEEQLVTVITTPLSPKDLFKTYGNRFASILQESCFFVHVDGSDYRAVFQHAGE